MNTWQGDLLGMTDMGHTVNEVFGKITQASQALGFEFCAYGLRLPTPISNPRTIMLSNYPLAWQARYASQGYLAIDPTVAHGRHSQLPLVWNQRVFAATPDLWDESQSFGLRVGWAQSSLDAVGVGGMLSLARSTDHLSAAELATQEVKMRWLVNISHLALSRLFVSELVKESPPDLTCREIEVLKWTADGKSSCEIADLLSISENTVNFHIKNSVVKLRTANRTAAVVRAAMLGLLN
ncbi:MAG: autoinducer binding domain-containing protein [Pseudomonadota bacterium]